ncbi:hypothetical protein FIBSPDRAFT_708239, partial [Athelia psychrophila]
KKYHLRTYKHHSLPDYVHNIREFGTTDSFSTEPPELEHRKPKRRFVRTSRKLFVRQLARIERCEARVRRIRQRLYGKTKRTKQDDEGMPGPEIHHHMGKTENDWLEMGSFLRDNNGDPAIKAFLPKLKSHLLPRILSILKGQEGINVESLPSPGTCDADEVLILGKHNRIYEHRILRVNYTTYDVRRDQDMINAHSAHCNIMVLSRDQSLNDSDPGALSYRYGRVLGTYHAKVIYNGPGRIDYQQHRIEFVWVRWFDEVGREGIDPNQRRLPRLRFVPLDDDDAFGIVDPSDILRGCHVVPRFSRGQVHTDNSGQSNLARDALDWKEYYVNRFVDRDMVLRYHFGYGVGHVYS